MPCHVGDIGVFLATTSMPVGLEIDFWDKYVYPLFENYRSQLRGYLKEISKNKTSDALEEFEEYLYKPLLYVTLDGFDLACLSLVETYNFSAHCFRPFEPAVLSHFRESVRPFEPPELKQSGKSDRPFERSFWYQVDTCSFPILDIEKNPIKEIWARRVLRTGEKRLPLMGVTSLKLNNALGCSMGVSFMRGVIKAIIRYLRYKEIDALVAESGSWHEITVLTWSQRLSSLAESSTRIGEMNLGGLRRILAEHKDPDIDDETIERSLVGEMIEKENKGRGGAPFDINTNHIFTKYTTFVGFDHELFRDPQTDKVMPIESDRDEEKLTVYRRWYSKPGHIFHAAEIVMDGKPYVDIALGAGEFLHQFNEPNPILKSVVGQVRGSRIAEKAGDHLYRAKCDLSWKMANPSPDPLLPLDSSLEGHYNCFEPIISSLEIPFEKIHDFHDRFRRALLPKVTTVRLLNILSSYNEGIEDKTLMSSFTELTPFVEWMISEGTTDEIADAEDRRYPMIGLWKEYEHAYHNRIHASYNLSQISDFNLDLKGGIHLFVTAMDAAYKAISDIVGNPKAFVWVGLAPFVEASAYSVHCSYLHVFQPEFFASASIHEAAHCGFAANEIRKKKEDGSLDGFIRILNRKLYRKGDPPFTKQATEIIENIAADVPNFFLAFSKNADLFLWWYLFNVWQSPFFERDLRSDKDRWKSLFKIISILIRIQAILRTTKGTTKSAKNPGDSKWLRDSVSRFWKMNDELARAVDLAWDAVEALYKNKRFKKWIEEITGLFDKLLKEARPKYENDSTALIEKFEIGEVIEYTPDSGNLFSAVGFVSSLYYSFLKLIHDRNWDGESRRASILRRGPVGLPLRPEPDDPTGNDLSFVSDSRGGNFIGDAEERRDYFRWVATFAMSLWDFAMKRKFEFWRRRLKSSAAASCKALPSEPFNADTGGRRDVTPA